MANPINNANTPNIETRGGLYPDLNNLRYNITTEQCEAYIQKKFNTVLAMMRAGKCTDKDGKPLPAVDLGEITIKLKTAAALNSKRMFPFMLLMPPKVLINWEDETKQTKRVGLSCFYQNQADGYGQKSQLHEPIAELIEQIGFDETSRNWLLGKDGAHHRREYDLTEHDARLITIEYATAKLMTAGRGKDATKMVALYVNPFKIFRDMLVFEDPKMKSRQFEPVILGTPTKIKDGNYSYYIQRKVVNGKHGKNNDASSIEARMQRGH